MIQLTWCFVNLELYQAEQAPILQTYGDTTYFDNNTAQYVKDMNLQRGTWRNNQNGDFFLVYDAPDVSYYTGMPYFYYCIVFVVLYFAHLIALLILKQNVSQDFKKLNLLEKLLHCLASTSFAFPVKDWDFEKGGGPHEHYARMKANHYETKWNIIINLLFNCCLLVPLVYLCKCHLVHLIT